jgi:hypothetical protein
MANRKNTFLLKRSNVVNKVPSLGDIQLGEIALNTADAKLFSTYTGGLTGATEIREIGWDRLSTISGGTVNGTLVVDTISATTIIGSVSGLTLNDLDDVTSNIPTTPDNTYQGRLLYFDVTDNQWVTGEEYVSTGNVTIWAKKGTAGTIDKGCPVYITGFDNDIHEVELANATTASTMPVIGFTGEDFDNAGVYPLITFGKLVGVDTTSTVSTINPNGETWAVNDVLYMNTTDGGLTKFRPPGTNTQIQRIAKVLRVATTSGQLFIFNTARTAGLPNLTTDYLWLGNGNDTPQEVIRTDVGITTTGFTYNDNNTFTITDDNGGSLSTTINQVSGLTINGNLGVTGDTTINGRLGVTGDTIINGRLGVTSDTTINGRLGVTGTVNIGTLGAGTSINTLGIDSNGYVVSGNTTSSDSILISYFNVSNSSLADNRDYYLGQMTGLQGNANSIAHIVLPVGTITEAYIEVFCASTLASGENIRVSFVSDGGATINTLSSTVTATSKHNYFLITGLSISIVDGGTYINITTPTFTTNPTAVQFRVGVKLEL